MPESRLRQLLKFVRVFGITGGTRLWLSLTFQMSFQSGPLTLHLPNMPAPIHLRRHDLPIFWQIMVMKENDFHSLPQAASVTADYAKILAEGKKPVIVDCGGHIGLSTLWFTLHFPEATIYVIEPDSRNFKLLQQNTSAYPKVLPLNGGVWNRSCHLEISNPDSGSASFRLREVDAPSASQQANLLRAYTIPEVVQREPANRLFLVKMDIEGAESDVFRGPAEWLPSAKVLIIELHDWLMPGQGTSKNFFKHIAENNFDVVLNGENLLLFRVPDPVVTPNLPLSAPVMQSRA
jgi:FkbM family methyltransferase